MSLLSINVDDPSQRKAIREFVNAFLVNRVGALRIADNIELQIERKSDHITVNWVGHVEVKTPAISPDLIAAKFYKTHAVVDLRISGLRINYGP